MVYLVEQFRGSDWRYCSFEDTKADAEAIVARYQRNNPSGSFRVRQGRLPRMRSPMAYND